jgi:hypothetical protein
MTAMILQKRCQRNVAGAITGSVNKTYRPAAGLVEAAGSSH